MARYSRVALYNKVQNATHNQANRLKITPVRKETVEIPEAKIMNGDQAELKAEQIKMQNSSSPETLKTTGVEKTGLKKNKNPAKKATAVSKPKKVLALKKASSKKTKSKASLKTNAKKATKKVVVKSKTLTKKSTTKTKPAKKMMAKKPVKKMSVAKSTKKAGMAKRKSK
jgi:hypothetical protein